MKHNISFVILNYKSTKDTIECLDSISKININGQVTTIVVDNNSLNEKEEEQIKKLCTDYIRTNSNVGFAKGNNIGVRYAKNKYNPDFICVINSDIIIEQKDFINKIYDLYKKYNFDMLGPKILPISTSSVNPFPVYKDLETVRNKIKYTERLIKIYNSFLLRNLLKIYMRVKKLLKKQKPMLNGIEDINCAPLHGCAIIFSQNYLNKYDDVFFNETFLFHEEEFLYYRVKHDNLISVYSPQIELIHKEGQSLNKEFKKDTYAKKIFKCQEILKSLKILEKVMQENKKI